MLGNIGRNPGGPERENPAVAWYLTRKEWPRDTYPMWADGGSGFVLSMVSFLLISACEHDAAVYNSMHQQCLADQELCFKPKMVLAFIRRDGRIDKP